MSGFFKIVIGFLLGVLAAMLVYDAQIENLKASYEAQYAEAVEQISAQGNGEQSNGKQSSSDEQYEQIIKMLNDIKSSNNAASKSSGKSTSASNTSAVAAKESAQPKAAASQQAASRPVNTTTDSAARSGGYNIKTRQGKTVTLYIGMTKEEVLGLLGEPESFRTYSYSGEEKYEYVTGTNKYGGLVVDLYLTFRNGKLSEIDKN